MKAPRFDVDGFLRRLWALDDALAPLGFPRFSPWWKQEIERWFRALAGNSGKLRQWVVRAGRRAGKSTTWCKLSVAWGLYGPWSVPSGDVGVVALISVSRDEAAQRLRTIAAILTALGVAHDVKAEQIELSIRPCVFKVFTCSSAAVGHTSILVIGDEVSRWENRDHSANPAREVCGSQRPTLATQPWGFMILSSSPWTKDDYHAQQFDLGATAFQLTSFAETWIANDSLTEEATRALEPDLPTWLREYAAQPSDGNTSNWFGHGVERAIEKDPMPGYIEGVTYTVALDQAFEADRFGYAVASSQAGPWDAERCVRLPRITRIHLVGSWAPDRPPREMLLRVRNEICAPFHTRTAVADQYAGPPLRQLARDVGLNLRIVPWTSGSGEDSKGTRYRAVRTAMFESAFRIPNDPDLIRELRSVRGVLSPSGNERIEIPRTAAGHGDRVSAIVLAGSIALAGPAQLSPGRMSWQEKRLEEIRQQQRERLMSAL